MKADEFLRMYDTASTESVILNIDGVQNWQEVSMDAKPLLDGIRDYHVAFFWLEGGKLALRLELDERPF